MPSPLRTYAIGDIHGHLDLLKAAHARIAADRARVGDGGAGGGPDGAGNAAGHAAGAPVVHVGDLVDRGPDSAGVVEYLVSGIAQGFNWLVLKGNHDRMFARFLADSGHHDPRLRRDLAWLHPRLGGIETLESYGIADPATRPRDTVHVEAAAAVPAAHRAFLETLPVHCLRGEVLFVHAGIRPGVPLAEQTEDDLIWIRDIFLDDPRDHGVLVIHGHSPVERATHFGNRVDIDTGAAYGGPLTAVVVEGRDVFELTETGRVALRPEV